MMSKLSNTEYNRRSRRSVTVYTAAEILDQEGYPQLAKKVRKAADALRPDENTEASSASILPQVRAISPTTAALPGGLR